jgi:hypothetical protein
MSDKFATIIVEAPAVVNLRKFSQMTGKADLDGMFVTALSATGALPATHYISSGMVPEAYLDMLSAPDKLHARAKAAWEADGLAFPFTLAQVTTALSKVTVSDGTRTDDIDGVPTVADEDPHALIARMGLQMVRGAV